MKDIARLLLIVALGYGLYTYFVKSEVEVPSDEPVAEEDSPARCIERLGDAVRETESAIRAYPTPPVEADAFDDRYDKLRQRRDLAAAACNCSGDACARAREAVGQLTNLNGDLLGGVRDGTGMPLDAAAHLDQVQRTYEAAKALDL